MTKAARSGEKVIGKKRGRKKTEAGQKCDSALDKYHEQIFKDGKIARSCSKIYEKIAAELKVENPQIIYLQATRYFQSNDSKKNDCEDECETYDDSGDYDQMFTLNIDDVDIIRNFVDNQVYVRGVRSFLRLITWHFSKFTCTWHFDVCTVKQNELICTGTCKESKCNAKVFMNTEADRSTLRISLKNFNDTIVHDCMSMYMTGEHKDRIMKVLEQNTPYVTRSLLAADMLKEGDMIPGVLPKKAALRDMKSRHNIRENKKDQLDPDPVLSVAKMAMNEEKIFDHVAVRPFVVIYGTETQSALVKLRKKN